MSKMVDAMKEFHKAVLCENKGLGSVQKSSPNIWDGVIDDGKEKRVDVLEARLADALEENNRLRASFDLIRREAAEADAEAEHDGLEYSDYYFTLTAFSDKQDPISGSLSAGIEGLNFDRIQEVKKYFCDYLLEDRGVECLVDDCIVDFIIKLDK